MDFAKSSGSAFFYPFDKVSQAFRLNPDTGFSGKILYLGKSFTAAFASMVLSFSPLDLLIGIAGAALIRLIIYVKGKNVKKYRKGTEYGSVRWGSAADIRLYIDPVFDNNILLT
jgi:type IV secretion system protein VirD4